MDDLPTLEETWDYIQDKRGITMTITDFTKITEHPIINFRQLCNECGINYNRMWAKVKHERPLTEPESQQIEQYLSANGIHWETLIQNN